MAEDFRIQVEADLDTSAITKQLADSFNISDKSVLKNLNKQLNSRRASMFFKMTGEECMLQEYQTVQLITQQQQNSITRKVSMLSEEH